MPPDKIQEEFPRRCFAEGAEKSEAKDVHRIHVQRDPESEEESSGYDNATGGDGYE
jgi:hypothetical protein